MVITLADYQGSINGQVLGGEIGAVYDNYDHFKLADSQYGISYAGKVVAIKFFYVDEGYTGGDSDGSIDKPFTNLSDAVSGIATIGKIYICSNLEMTNPVDIMSGTKDITIVNNGGTAHTITYSGPYRMISILGGTLSLGSKESGDDNNPSLILHCNNSAGFIYNADRLNLYPGVKLEGNVNPDTVSSGVYNDGQFNMYGGIITGNTGDYTGGVINFGTFFMEGGIISNCTGVMGGGVCNYYEAIFTMNGGRIESCTGGSIYCGGTTHISGNVSIPAGSGNNNDVIIEYGNSIIIDSNLSNTDQIQLTTVDPAPGNQVLSGTNEILLNNYQKFKYGSSTYEINSLGKIALLLNSTMVSWKNTNPLYYTGSEIKPSVNVKYGVAYLTEGTDYTVSYSNNINAGTAAAVVEGLGSYAGSVSVPFTINKAVVQSIGTAVPADQTFSASEAMTLDELRASIALSNVTVNLNQGTTTLPIIWAVSGGAYSPKGGTYTFTGSLTGNDNVDTNGKTLLAKITVTPVTLDKPVFGAVTVTEGTNGKAAAADLGSSVLPTTGTVVTAGTTVNYTITWDGSTLNMTAPGASNTFTGTITYTDAPAWATLPTDLNVTRKVSVTAKPTPIPTPTTPVIPPDIPAATITPTPEVTPELTPSPSGDAEDINAEVTVTVGQDQQNHELNASVTVSEESINNQTGTVTIPIISDEITESLQDDSITGVNIAVTVPDSITENDNISGSHIQLDADIIEAAKEAGKDVRIAVKDEDGTERYSWSFEGGDLAASDNEVNDLDLSLEIEEAEHNEEFSDLLSQGSQAGGDSTGSNSLVLSFGHHGELPAQASIRMYVGDMGYSEGDRVYLYYYNPDTGMLDTLPYSSDYIVDSEGYITVNITHCSEYVLLPQKAPADMITSLRDQISVKPDKAVLYTGTKAYSTAAISIKLPDTLELVSDLKEKTSGSAVGAVTVTYQSGNPKVAAVDSSGRITARGIGKTTIKVTAVLYSGKSRIFKIPVTVMKPYITITVSTGTMKVGESFTFTAQAYGLDINDIVWTTTQKSVVIIDKKTGKATAVKKGTDYVVASIGGISCKVKIIVK